MPPLLLLEVGGGDLDRHAAGDRGHRLQQRQAAVVELDGLVGDAGDAALEQLLGQLGRRGEVQVGVEDLPLAHARVLLGQRLLDLEDHLGALPHLVGGGDDLGARGRVVLVGDAASRGRRPACTSTLWPCAVSVRTPAGIMPTRYSRVFTSVGTPTIIGFSPSVGNR